jgi:hypothetical protein
MARYQPGSDATAARRLAKSEPLSGRNSRSDETPRLSHLDRLGRTPGSDPTAAIEALYRTGRTYPYGKPHDAPRERTPEYKVPQPGWEGEPASYKPGRNSPVTPAPDQSAPQFSDDKVGDHVDASGWVRGMGPQSPYVKFDAGPSGSRYDRKR